MLMTQNEWHQKSFAEIRAYIYDRYAYPRDAAEKLLEIYYDIAQHVESLDTETISQQEFLRWHSLIQQVEKLRHMFEQMAIHGNAELPPVPRHGGRPRPTKQEKAESKADVEQMVERVATPLVTLENTVVADGVRYSLHDVVGVDVAAKVLGYSKSYLYEMNKKSFTGRKPRTMKVTGRRKLQYRVSDLVAFRDGVEIATSLQTEEEQAVMNLRVVEMARERNRKKR